MDAWRRDVAGRGVYSRSGLSPAQLAGRGGPKVQGRIGKVAVSYRTARVTVGATASATQPPDIFVLGDTTTVDDFVSALKGVGLKADVIIGVLQAVEKAGALFGNLVIM